MNWGMDEMKKLGRLLRRLYVPRLLILLALLVGVMRGLPRFFADTEKPEIYTVEIEQDPPEAVPEGAVSLLFTGKELLHVNALYIDGKRVPVAYSSGIQYGSCRVAVDPARLPSGRTAVFRIGKAYPLSFGVIHMSNKLQAAL